MVRPRYIAPVKNPIRRVAVAAAAVALIAGACSSESKSTDATSAPAAATAAPTTPSSAATTTGAPETTAPDTTAPDTTMPDTTDAPVATDAPDTTGAEPTTDAPETTEAVATAPFATTTVTQTFVDPSRPTPATPSSAELPTRTIATTIVYPEAPGPFPLIVLNHGLTGLPSKLSRISTAWASAGYVVAMPAFPLTNGSVTDASGNVNDVVNQPGDDSFVIDSMLALSADDSSPLYGRVDGEHIGVAGHSLGSATTYGVALNSCCLDERIDAIVIMAGFVFIASADNDYSRPLPVMIVHGDADPVLNISLDQDVYTQLAGPKWFVTLIGGTHSTGIEDVGTAYDPVVDSSTTDFWNAYLSGDTGAEGALRTDAVVAGVSTLQSGA